MGTKYSQNFLVRDDIAADIVGALDLSREDTVLEIGPGRGVLTRILLKSGADLTAVEIDRSLAVALENQFRQSRLKLITADFLETNLETIFSQDAGVKVVGNLPYAVTSPILQKVLAWNAWSVAVFMVQKEVGERLLASPKTKAYGILTVSVQSRASVEKVMDVPAAAFSPVPKVESMVLRLRPLKNAAFSPEEETIFFKAVKAAFAHRRKMAGNSLARALGIPTSVARGALEACGLSPTDRAEDFSVQDFVRLSRVLYNIPHDQA